MTSSSGSTPERKRDGWRIVVVCFFGAVGIALVLSAAYEGLIRHHYAHACFHLLLSFVTAGVVERV